MIVIYSAMYHEAKPLIECFRLQKVSLSPAPGRLQWFTGQPEQLGWPVHLVVGGTGPLAAAVGTTYALTRLLVDSDIETITDETIVFLNVGIAGSRRSDWPPGEAVLCHKIIHHDTGRAFYPDILVSHPFQEGVLETFSRPVTAASEEPVQKKAAVSSPAEKQAVAEQKLAANATDETARAGGPTSVAGDVVDMEGAGCFAAAAAFLPPHQMYFVKIVSDHLNPKRTEQQAATPAATAVDLDGPAVARLVSKQVPALEQLLRSVQEMETAAAPPLLSREEEQLVQTLTKQLRLSVTMAHQFRHLCLQYKAVGGQDLAERLHPWLDHTVESKHERNAVFAQIRQALLPG